MKRSGVFVGWDDAELVEAARGDRPSAYGELFERWYDRCYDVALNICRNGETAADVAQDTFLVCWEQLAQLRDPGAFGGWVLRTTRNRALNRLERERTRSHDPIDTEEPMAVPDTGPGPDAEAERDDRRRLVWTAAAALGERDTSLLDLHLRHGLEPSEIAEELSITPNSAYQLLHRLRGRLRDTIGAVLLWREGRPTCHDLAGLVEGTGSFDADAATTIQRHRRRCLSCSAEFLRQTQPELLFSSVPVAVAATVLKDQARAALARAGVPVGMPPSAPAAATGPAQPTGPAQASTGPAQPSASGPPVTRRPVPGRAVGAAAAGVVLLALLGGSTVVRGHGRPSDEAAGSRPRATAVALPVQQPVTPPTPASSTPGAATSTSSTPGGSTSAGSTSAGSKPAGSKPAGSAPAGSAPAGSKPAGSKGGSSRPAGGTAAVGSPARDVRAGTVPATGTGAGTDAGTAPGAGDGALPASGPDGDPLGAAGYASRMRCPGQARARGVRIYTTASGELVVTARCGGRIRWWLVAACAAPDVPPGPDVLREPLSRTVCLFSSDRVPPPGPHPHRR